MRMPTTPTSTRPRPAGVNGTAVSSEAISATKNAPLMPMWMSKPSAWMTKYRRIASVAQIRTVSRASDRQRRASIEKTPSSKRS